MVYFLRRGWRRMISVALMLALLIPACALGASYPTLQLDDESDDVMEMQTELKEQGYYTGSITGHFGAKTQDAVKKFQRAKGLEADGIAGPKTLELLYEGSSSSSGSSSSNTSSSGVLKQGVKSDAVLQLQTRLKELGYYTGSLTGNFGDLTRQAVEKFQRANGLTADGIAGTKTLELLNKSGSASSGSESSSSSTSSSGVLKQGVKSDAVLQLQTRLKELGYYTGSLTGNFGDLTRQAVEKFQRANGLTADGIAGTKTLELLEKGTASDTSSSGSGGTSVSTSGLDMNTTLRLNSKSDTVTAVQERLKALKYYTGNITGNYGQKTMAAVKEFQAKNGLMADGLAGAKTLSALFSATALDANASSVSSTTTSSASASKVQNVNWYSMRSKYEDGIIVTVYDFDTGLSWNLKTMSKDKHWDMEPVSSADVTTMYKAFGNKTTWTPKAVWVTFPDGATYIASTANTPHGTYHITNNNFAGHLCVHFPLSMETAEGIGPNAVSFQKAIVSGWEKTKELAGK